MPHVVIYHANLSFKDWNFVSTHFTKTECDVGRNTAKENYEETSPWITFIGNSDFFMTVNAENTYCKYSYYDQ